MCAKNIGKKVTMLGIWCLTKLDKLNKMQLPNWLLQVQLTVKTVTADD